MSNSPDQRLSHIDESGDSRMVDVSQKAVTARRARASGQVRMRKKTREAIAADSGPKGSVLGTARIAGVQAAKRTGFLIPLCHPLGLDLVQIDFRWEDDVGAAALLTVEAEAVATARTGGEMEALTAVSVAALTVYDMTKAIDRSIVLENIRLEEKLGGKSGHWQRKDS